MHRSYRNTLIAAGGLLLLAAAAAHADVAQRVASGTYVGDGTNGRAIDVGFQPSLVIVQGENGEPAVARTSTMPVNKCKSLGTNDPFLVNAIKTTSSTGFTLGSDPTANAAGTTYHWVAFAASDGELVVGTYVGDDTDDRSIDGMGFTPAHVIVMSEAGEQAMHRFENQANDKSFEFHGGGEKGDCIQDFEADGFQVGKNNAVNKNNVTFHYVAWGAVTGRIAENGYLGDGEDPRAITGLGFDPAVVIVRHREGDRAVFRSATMTGDLTLAFETGVMTDAIQALLPDGFEIGGDNHVNKSNDDYYWVAFRDAPLGDLTLSKSVDDPTPIEGQAIAFTITVGNLGPSDATAVLVSDPLPEGLSYVGDTPSRGGYDPGTGIWTIGDLGVGEPATLTLGAQVDPGTGGTSIENTAKIGSDETVDPVPANGTDAALVEVQALTDLDVMVSVDDAAPNEEQTITYTVAVANLSDSEATGVEIADPLPFGVTHATNTPSRGIYLVESGRWVVGTLPAHSAATLVISCAVDEGTAGTTITNTALVTHLDQIDPVDTNDTDDVDIVVRGADLVLVQTVDDAAPDEGQTITYTIDLSNGGPQPAGSIDVTDLLPSGVTFVSATTSQGVYASGSGVWSVGSLAVGGSATLTVDALVDLGMAGETILNTAAVTAASPADAARGNESDSVSVTVRSVDLTVGMNVDDATPNAGDTVTYTLTVSNGGPDDASDVEVTDVLPPGVTYQTDTPSQGTYVDGTGVWSIGTLPASSAATLVIIAVVDVGTAGDVIANTATRTASTPPDTEPGNDTASRTVTIQAADLAVLVDVDETNPNEGQSITYTLTVTNAGPDAATGVAVADLLPSGVTYAANVPSQGTYASGTGVWSVGTLAAAMDATLEVGAVVDAGTSGSTITNTASVSAVDQEDPAPGDESDGAAIIVQSADLRLTKVVNNPAPEEGATVTYTLTLDNLGPDAATGAVVTDLLPAGVTYQTHVAGQGSYVSGTGVWIIGNVSAGTDVTLTLVGRADTGTAGSTITNTAAVTAVDQQDPSPGDEAASVDITPAIGGSGDLADLRVDMTVDDATPNEGQAIAFSIVLTNNGPDPATSVQLVDMLPTSLAYTTHTVSQGDYDSGTGTWTVGSLAALQSDTLSLVATAANGTAGATVTNTAAVTSVVQGDPTPGDESDGVSIVVRGADLLVDKMVDEGSPVVGQTITYTLTVMNGGPDTAGGIEVTDLLPSGVTYQAQAPSQGVYAPDPGTWTVGSLDPSQSATLQIMASVDVGTDGTTIVNTAELTAVDTGDPVPGNESDTASITVRTADLAVQIDVDDAAPDEGQSLVHTVTLENRGPGTATGIALTCAFPPGLTLTGDTPSQGSYASGVWNAGSLVPDATATLALTASVDSGTAATTITTTAAVTAAVESDPIPGNDADSVAVTVRGADLSVALSVNDESPGESQTVTFTLSVANGGPDTADGIVVDTFLPDGLTYASHVVTNGVYVEGTGTWTLGTIAPGASAALLLSATVDAGTGGTVLTTSSSLTAVDQGDPLPGDESASLDITIEAADIELRKTVDDPSPAVGQVITYTVTVTNHGPDVAADVQISDVLPSGVSYEDDVPSDGIYLSTSGLWAMGTIAPGDSASLAIAVSVDESAAGMSITNVASRLASHPIDPVLGNDTGGALILVDDATGIVLTADVLPGDALYPGGEPEPVLRLHLTNGLGTMEVLSALTVTNTSVGPGLQTQLDADWQPLELRVGGSSDAIETASFAGGRADFGGLSLPIPPGTTLDLDVYGGASLVARDGDVLDLLVEGPADVTFAGGATASTSWPIDPVGAFPVDGMTALQIGSGTVGSSGILTGSSRNLVMSLRIPPNGYESDVLQRLNVKNDGDAAPGTDIQRVEAWIDADDTGTFDPAFDLLLGDMVDTGERWEITGLTRAIPSGGLGVLVTCDVAPLAGEGRSIRMSVPAAPEAGVGVLSSNDGPVDVHVQSPTARTITTSNRVTWSALEIPSSIVSPRDRDVPLLHLFVVNSYMVTKTLETLRVTNRTVGPGTLAQLDAELDRLVLRHDGNGDGLLGTTGDDPIIGIATLDGGHATFTGLDLDLASNTSCGIFVIGDVSKTRARDGDVLGVRITEAASITYGDATSTAGSWPLDSGGSATVDGMIAAQITASAPPPATLGPDEGPALALDLVIPDDGYADDVLTALRIRNDGSATNADLGEVRLWADGGDASFDAGAGDDVNVTGFVFDAGGWVTPVISAPLSGGGGRFFVSIRASATPTDSATVAFAVPIGGVTVESGNDGPVDTEIPSPPPILLSTAVLLATLDVDPSVSTVGATVTATQHVRNMGTEAIVGIVPSALASTGSGTLSELSGPVPATLDLNPDEEAAFVWTLHADSAGTVQLSSSVSGTESGSGFPRRSLTVESDIHRIYVEAQALDLFPVASMPFSVNRGQTEVVPLSLTFASPFADGSSDIRLMGLRLRVEDQFGAGIVPADLISRIVVSEGAELYLEKTALETSGADMDLTLTQPVLIESNGSGGQATVGLAIDIADSTVVPSFLLAIDDSTWIRAEDATSGAAVSVRLQGASYPVSSGLARVVGEAERLEVAGDPVAAQLVTRGQPDVGALTLHLLNPDPNGIAADIRVGAFDVAFVDSAGSPIDRPADFVSRVYVVTASQTLYTRGITGADGSTLSLSLSTPVTVPVNSEMTLSVVVDIADAAGLDAFQVRLVTPAAFDARDTNTGTNVPVVYATDPLPGDVIIVQTPAESVTAAGDGLLQPVVTVGDRNITAMTLSLTHPGMAGSASIRCETLTFRLRDDRDDPLVPATFLDAVGVRVDTTQVGAESAPATSGDAIVVPITGVTIPPSSIVTLTVFLDIEATAPSSFLGMFLDGAEIAAVDANSGNPLPVFGESEGAFRLSSNITRLNSPARELTAHFESRMPPVLAPDGRPVEVARMVLRNPEPASSGVIRVESVELRAESGEGTPVTIGRSVARVDAFVADTLWATSGTLDDAMETAVLLAETPLTIAPDLPVTLTLKLTPGDRPVATSLRLGCAADGIGVIQPQSAVLSVTVQAAAGESFPFWTEIGSFSGLTLADSYSSFPNPFPAGRGTTTFVFFLPRPANVTLKVFTPRGEPVRTVIEGDGLGAGLHQASTWDGRNGRGRVVRNGVYIAQIDVAFADGSHERLRRKVAVVR